MVRQKFSELSTLNQERARAIFFNAGPEDGYLYELNIHEDPDGRVD